MLPTLKSWWSRPCGGRAVLAMALPLVISMMSSTLMVFTDRMFLTWYSTNAVAAALPAGMVHISVLCFPLGVASYVNTFVAQYHGAGRPHRIGPIVWQGLWLSLAWIPLLLLTIPLAGIAFARAGHEPAIAALEADYYRILTLGAGAALLAATQSSLFTGLGRTRIVMVVDSTAAALNALLDYLWIFGYCGFPEGGIAGAAWATTVAEWSRVAIYAVIMARAKYRRPYHLDTGWRWSRPLTLRLLRFGGPGGLQWLTEAGAFTLFILLVGRLGKESLAATNLAFNVNTLAWLPMLGLGTAVSTLVGQNLGRNQPNLAARATWTALGLALGYMGLFVVAYVAVPDVFLMGHAAGATDAGFGSVRALAVVLLRFVAAYCIFDALNLTFVSAIRGAGDMRFILITTPITSITPLALVWWGIQYMGWGLFWAWTILTLWVCSLGLIYMARFLQGRWRHMRVIEPEHEEVGYTCPGPLVEHADPGASGVLPIVSASDAE